MTPERIDLRTCEIEIGKDNVPGEIYLKKGKRIVLRIPVSRINDLCCSLHRLRIFLTCPKTLSEIRCEEYKILLPQETGRD